MARRRLERRAWGGGRIAAADAAEPVDARDAGSDGTPPTRSLPMHLNSIALIAGKMATMGVGFLAWLVAARLFAPADVGLAAGAVSAMMLCVQLALFGVGAAIISLYPEHQRRPAALLDTAVTVVALAALAVAAGFLVLATGAFRELGVIGGTPAYTAAFLAMCVFGALGVLLDQISTALRRGDQALTRGALSGVVTLGALIAAPVLAGQTGVLAILAAWVAGNFAPVALGAGQLRRTLSGYWYRPAIRSDLALRLVGVGLPNWALTLAERAPGSILPIVVTEILSPAANATWYAAWMMAWVVYIIPIQVGLSLFAEAAHRPNELGRAVRLGLGLSLAIGVVGAIGAAFVGPIMLSILGPTYVDGGTTTLRILLVAVVPFAFIQAYYSACRSRQRLTEAIFTGIVSGLAGVAAAAAAALAYGLPGMATAWLATQCLAGLWALWRLRALSKQRWGQAAESRAGGFEQRPSVEVGRRPVATGGA